MIIERSTKKDLKTQFKEDGIEQVKCNLYMFPYYKGCNEPGNIFLIGNIIVRIIQGD